MCLEGDFLCMWYNLLLLLKNYFYSRSLLSAVSMSAVGATARLEYKYHTPIHRLCFINIVPEKRRKTFPELRSLFEEERLSVVGVVN